jgi:Kef-type K+ transport system membrane component KefB
LHSEIKQIFNAKNFIVAFFGVVIPFVAGYYYAVAAGHTFGYAMFLGAALTATSVGVTVAVLQEFRLLEKEFAKIILGAAVIDDILALLVLSLVKNVPAALDASALAPFAYTLGIAALFVIGGIKLGQYIVSKYFDDALVGEKLPNTVFLGILAYVLAYSYVAEYIGLSAIVGAFIAGITLNYSRLTQKIFELFYTLEAFFTPIFFISLGMFVNLPALAENLLPVLLITLLAIATKLVACGIAARASGSGLRDSVLVGLGMVPRGEIALIIGLYGLTAIGPDGATLIGATEYSIIASMAFLTTIVTPWLLQKTLASKAFAQPAN